MRRFELLEEVTDVARRQPIRAWDQVFRRTVAVKRFAVDLSPHGAGARLMAAWEQWLAAPHPGLLRPAVLDFQMGWLVREWVHGFSLLELLRQRKKLDAGEAFALMPAAAAILDHAAAHHLGSGFDKWLVQFHAGEEMEVRSLLSAPVEQWPVWSLRLEPIRLAALVSSAEDRTVRSSPNGASGIAPAVVALHEFVRELLGGSKIRTGAPLAALNDATNAVLSKAVQPKAFTSAQALSDALLAAAASDVTVSACAMGWSGGTVREYVISPEPPQPDSVQGTASGEVLLLEPLAGKSRPVQLVARGEFRFGRSALHADFVARFPDHIPQAKELTLFLGRVHGRAKLSAGDIFLFDGSESSPSRNGSFTAGGPLRQSEGTRVHGATLIQFGTHWRALLLPVLAPAEMVAFRHGEETATPSVPALEQNHRKWGTVFVLPQPGCNSLIEAIWLIEEAGFGLDVDGSPVWDTEAVEPAPAAFRTHAGSFFLLNRRMENGELSVNLRPVPTGYAVPLRDGMQLIVGKAEWRVRVA